MFDGRNDEFAHAAVAGHVFVEDHGEGVVVLDPTVVHTGAVKEAGGPAIDRRKIEVVPPIKSTGRHSATVRLHADVVAPIEVNVVARRR